MSRSLPIPIYAVVERTGPDHAPHFRMAVQVEGLEPGFGEGTSKRVAEQAAAGDLLAREGITAAGDAAAETHDETTTPRRAAPSPPRPCPAHRLIRGRDSSR